MSSTDSIERVEFCDLLRALAVLIVVFAHYIVGFSALSNWLYNPENVIDFYSFLGFFSWIDGVYGVAIFFLISGFLIPLSLTRYGVQRFLVARFFRLVPTYAVCLSVVVGVSLLFGTSNFDISLLQNYFLNITLMRDLLGGVILDSVIWTLEIEVKFYLYIAAIYLLLKKRFVYCVWVNIAVSSVILLRV